MQEARVAPARHRGGPIPPGGVWSDVAAVEEALQAPPRTPQQSTAGPALRLFSTCGTVGDEESPLNLSPAASPTEQRRPFTHGLSVRFADEVVQEQHVSPPRAHSMFPSQQSYDHHPSHHDVPLLLSEWGCVSAPVSQSTQGPHPRRGGAGGGQGPHSNRHHQQPASWQPDVPAPPSADVGGGPALDSLLLLTTTPPRQGERAAETGRCVSPSLWRGRLEQPIHSNHDRARGAHMLARGDPRSDGPSPQGSAPNASAPYRHPQPSGEAGPQQRGTRGTQGGPIGVDGGRNGGGHDLADDEDTANDTTPPVRLVGAYAVGPSMVPKVLVHGDAARPVGAHSSGPVSAPDRRAPSIPVAESLTESLAPLAARAAAAGRAFSQPTSCGYDAPAPAQSGIRHVVPLSKAPPSAPPDPSHPALRSAHTAGVSRTSGDSTPLARQGTLPGAGVRSVADGRSVPSLSSWHPDHDRYREHQVDRRDTRRIDADDYQLLAGGDVAIGHLGAAPERGEHGYGQRPHSHAAGGGGGVSRQGLPNGPPFRGPADHASTASEPGVADRQPTLPAPPASPITNIDGSFAVGRDVPFMEDRAERLYRGASDAIPTRSLYQEMCGDAGPDGGAVDPRPWGVGGTFAEDGRATYNHSQHPSLPASARSTPRSHAGADASAGAGIGQREMLRHAAQAGDGAFDEEGGAGQRRSRPKPAWRLDDDEEEDGIDAGAAVATTVTPSEAHGVSVSAHAALVAGGTEAANASLLSGDGRATRGGAASAVRSPPPCVLQKTPPSSQELRPRGVMGARASTARGGGVDDDDGGDSDEGAPQGRRTNDSASNEDDAAHPPSEAPCASPGLLDRSEPTSIWYRSPPSGRPSANAPSSHRRRGEDGGGQSNLRSSRAADDLIADGGTRADSVHTRTRPGRARSGDGVAVDDVRGDGHGRPGGPRGKYSRPVAGLSRASDTSGGAAEEARRVVDGDDDMRLSTAPLRRCPDERPRIPSSVGARSGGSWAGRQRAGAGGSSSAPRDSGAGGLAVGGEYPGDTHTHASTKSGTAAAAVAAMCSGRADVDRGGARDGGADGGDAASTRGLPSQSSVVDGEEAWRGADGGLMTTCPRDAPDPVGDAVAHNSSHAPPSARLSSARRLRPPPNTPAMGRYAVGDLDVLRDAPADGGPRGVVDAETNLPRNHDGPRPQSAMGECGHDAAPFDGSRMNTDPVEYESVRDEEDEAAAAASRTHSSHENASTRAFASPENTRSARGSVASLRVPSPPSGHGRRGVHSVGSGHVPPPARGRGAGPTTTAGPTAMPELQLSLRHRDARGVGVRGGVSEAASTGRDHPDSDGAGADARTGTPASEGEVFFAEMIERYSRGEGPGPAGAGRHTHKRADATASASEGGRSCTHSHNGAPSTPSAVRSRSDSGARTVRSPRAAAPSGAPYGAATPRGQNASYVSTVVGAAPTAVASPLRDCAVHIEGDPEDCVYVARALTRGGEACMVDAHYTCPACATPLAAAAPPRCAACGTPRRFAQPVVLGSPQPQQVLPTWVHHTVSPAPAPATTAPTTGGVAPFQGFYALAANPAVGHTGAAAAWVGSPPASPPGSPPPHPPGGGWWGPHVPPATVPAGSASLGVPTGGVVPTPAPPASPVMTVTPGGGGGGLGFDAHPPAPAGAGVLRQPPSQPAAGLLPGTPTTPSRRVSFFDPAGGAGQVQLQLRGSRFGEKEREQEKGREPVSPWGPAGTPVSMTAIRRVSSVELDMPMGRRKSTLVLSSAVENFAKPPPPQRLPRPALRLATGDPSEEGAGGDGGGVDDGDGDAASRSMNTGLRARAASAPVASPAQQQQQQQRTKSLVLADDATLTAVLRGPGGGSPAASAANISRPGGAAVQGGSAFVAPSTGTAASASTTPQGPSGPAARRGHGGAHRGGAEGDGATPHDLSVASTLLAPLGPTHCGAARGVPSSRDPAWDAVDGESVPAGLAGGGPSRVPSPHASTVPRGVAMPVDSGGGGGSAAAEVRSPQSSKAAAPGPPAAHPQLIHAPTAEVNESQPSVVPASDARPHSMRGQDGPSPHASAASGVAAPVPAHSSGGHTEHPSGVLGAARASAVLSSTGSAAASRASAAMSQAPLYSTQWSAPGGGGLHAHVSAPGRSQLVPRGDPPGMPEGSNWEASAGTQPRSEVPLQMQLGTGSMETMTSAPRSGGVPPHSTPAFDTRDPLPAALAHRVESVSTGGGGVGGAPLSATADAGPGATVAPSSSTSVHTEQQASAPTSWAPGAASPMPTPVQAAMSVSTSSRLAVAKEVESAQRTSEGGAAAQGASGPSGSSKPFGGPSNAAHVRPASATDVQGPTSDAFPATAAPAPHDLQAVRVDSTSTAGRTMTQWRVNGDTDAHAGGAQQAASAASAPLSSIAGAGADKSWAGAGISDGAGESSAAVNSSPVADSKPSSAAAHPDDAPAHESMPKAHVAVDLDTHASHPQLRPSAARGGALPPAPHNTYAVFKDDVLDAAAASRDGVPYPHNMSTPVSAHAIPSVMKQPLSGASGGTAVDMRSRAKSMAVSRATGSFGGGEGASQLIEGGGRGSGLSVPPGKSYNTLSFGESVQKPSMSTSRSTLEGVASVESRTMRETKATATDASVVLTESQATLSVIRPDSAAVAGGAVAGRDTPHTHTHEGDVTSSPAVAQQAGGEGTCDRARLSPPRRRVKAAAPVVLTESQTTWIVARVAGAQREGDAPTSTAIGHGFHTMNDAPGTTTSDEVPHSAAGNPRLSPPRARVGRMEAAVGRGGTRERWHHTLHEHGRHAMRSPPTHGCGGMHVRPVHFQDYALNHAYVDGDAAAAAVDLPPASPRGHGLRSSGPALHALTPSGITAGAGGDLFATGVRTSRFSAALPYAASPPPALTPLAAPAWQHDSIAVALMPAVAAAAPPLPLPRPLSGTANTSGVHAASSAAPSALADPHLQARALTSVDEGGAPRGPSAEGFADGAPLSDPAVMSTGALEGAGAGAVLATMSSGCMESNAEGVRDQREADTASAAGGVASAVRRGGSTAHDGSSSAVDSVHLSPPRGIRHEVVPAAHPVISTPVVPDTAGAGAALTPRAAQRARSLLSLGMPVRIEFAYRMIDATCTLVLGEKGDPDAPRAFTFATKGTQTTVALADVASGVVEMSCRRIALHLPAKQTDVVFEVPDVVCFKAICAELRGRVRLSVR